MSPGVTGGFDPLAPEVARATRERFLHVSALGSGLAVGAYTFFFVWLQNQSLLPPDVDPAVGFIPAGVSTGFLLAWLAVRRGRTLLANGLFVLTLTSFLLVPAIVRGLGIYSSSLLVLPTLVVFTGFISGPLGALLVSLFALLCVIAFYALTRLAWIDSSAAQLIASVYPAEQFLLIYSTLILMTGWITTRYAASVRHSQQEQRRRALRLQQAVEALEDAQVDMARLNERLAERTRQAEAANLAKGRFLALMSHEIRTPLNGVIGMAQLLQQPGLPESERESHVKTIIESGEMLHALLRDILDLSRAEAGRMDLVARPFDARALLERTIRLFNVNARSKGLWLVGEFLDEGPRHYVGDDIRLQQMLSNLIVNAIKFTDKGGVTVTVREQRRDPRGVLLEFAVTDTGIGIPKEKFPALFQPFSQLGDVMTRREGGAGLGLSIVRNLALQMGGETGVDSRAGEGSRFWFTARVEPAVAEAPTR